MNQEKLPTPYFDEVTIGQELHNIDGTTSFSLLNPPSNPKHAIGMEERTSGEGFSGRTQYVDIDDIRQQKSAELEVIDEEYAEKKILETGEGHKVGVRIVNKGAEGGTIGVMTSWSTDAEWENSKGIIEALALTYPDKQIVYIETPGMGDSDKLTKARKNKLVSTGSFKPMAEQLAPALKEAGIKFDVLVGTSEGGRAVISLATEMDTKLVVTQDPPGTDEQSILKFGKRFALDEGKAQKAVIENSPDRPMAEAHKDIDSKILAKHPYKATKRQLLTRARGMSLPGLESDIQNACDNDVVIFDIRSTASRVGSSDTAIGIVESTEGYNVITLPGAPHAIVEANPYAFSQLVAQAIDLHNKNGFNIKPFDALKALEAGAARRLLSE